MDQKKAMAEVVERHLDEVIQDGFEPQLIVFPDQHSKVPNCRVCQLPSKGPFLVSIFGRAVGKAYPYCIAMVCNACSQSKEKQQGFLDRLEARYKVVNGLQ